MTKQLPYSNFQLISHALTRQRLPIEQFTSTSIKLAALRCNQYQAKQFSSIFTHVNSLPSFAFIVSYRYIAQLLVQSTIPSKLAGLVHISSQFEKHANHDWQQIFDLKVSINDCTLTEKGLVYAVHSEFSQHNQTTLINYNEILDRTIKPMAGNKIKPTTKHYSLPNGKRLCQSRITTQTAWQYAKLSGDYNPIHLTPLSAKMFGFKRNIIHGMYNVHFALTQINRQSSQIVNTISIKFNKPCFLPNQINLYQESSSRFSLYSGDNHDRFMTLDITFT